MPITILRLGAPSAETCARLGGYEDWIAQNLPTATRSIDIPGGEAPPAHADCRGVILTGSAHMVPERQLWSEATRVWLQQAVPAGLRQSRVNCPFSPPATATNCLPTPSAAP